MTAERRAIVPDPDVCRCSFCLGLLRAIENAERNTRERRKMLTTVPDRRTPTA